MSLDDIKVFSVDDIKMQMQKFGWLDYGVFILMLISCSMIGVYFAFFKKNVKNSEDESNYLVGGRKLKIFPVAMSLIASFISGISLLGTPTEIYIYGTQYMYIIGAIIAMGVVMMYVYLPVFHDLKLVSTYEYLQFRFDRKIRIFGSVLFVFGTMMWLPIVIYVPALAFNQVTNINIHIITPIVCLVCIFYTCLGGINAVIWTDVIQTIIMFFAIILIIVKGTSDVGGFDVVVKRAIESERIEGPDMSMNYKTRNTVWSLTIGGFFYWLKSMAISQNMVQRYLSLPTLKAAKKALWIFIAGVIILLSMCCYCGLLIYAKYYDCDPLTTKLAKAKDQLLPLLVVDTLGDYPGLSGLFVAGVFSAALSSLSTGLNSMSAVMLEDFFKPFVQRPLTVFQTKYIMRGTVFIFGAICVGLVFVVEKLGAVLQLSMSLGAVSQGPLLGIFTMGVLIPWIHGTGAIVGSSTALILMSWICFKAQQDISSGKLSFNTKIVSTHGCHYSFISDIPIQFNITSTPEPEPEEFKIYHMSYLWYTLVGASITIIISLIVSFLTIPNRPEDIDLKFLSPCIRKFIKPRAKQAATNDTENISAISFDMKSLESQLKMK